MVSVRYIGNKSNYPVYEPVGSKVRAQSKVRCLLSPQEILELKDDEATSLLSIDGANFERVMYIEKNETIPPKVRKKRRTKLEMLQDRNGIDFISEAN